MATGKEPEKAAKRLVYSEVIWPACRHPAPDGGPSISRWPAFSDSWQQTYLRVFTVSRTEEVGPIPLVIVGYAVIQLFSAVGAIEQSRKHTDDPAFSRSAAVSAQFLHQRKYLPVNDGGVSIQEYLPFVFRFIELFLHFERLAISSKVDGITAVFLFIKNARYSVCNPAISHPAGHSVVTGFRATKKAGTQMRTDFPQKDRPIPCGGGFTFM